MEYGTAALSKNATHPTFREVSQPIFKPLPKDGFKTKQEYGKNTEYSFVLTNRSTENIWIVVTSDKRIVIPAYFLAGHIKGTMQGVMARISLLPPYKQVRLMIWLADPGKNPVSPNALFREPPRFIYTFTKGKTMYLSWDKRKALRPQIGKFYGLSPFGATNFLLNDNVQPGDVIKIR